MPIDKDTLAQAQALMREGKIQEADDLLSKQIAEDEKTAAEASAAEPAPVAPRTPEEIVHAFFTEIVHHLGSTPRLAALMAEFEASLEKHAA